MPVQFHFDGQPDAKVFVGALTNKEGVMLYAGRTEDAVYAEIASYCEEWWSEVAHAGDASIYDKEAGCFVHIEVPTTYAEAAQFLSHEQIAHVYFGSHDSETLDCEWVAL